MISSILPVILPVVWVVWDAADAMQSFEFVWYQHHQPESICHDHCRNQMIFAWTFIHQPRLAAWALSRCAANWQRGTLVLDDLARAKLILGLESG